MLTLPWAIVPPTHKMTTYKMSVGEMTVDKMEYCPVRPLFNLPASYQ
jgi:hypothetical protein